MELSNTFRSGFIYNGIAGGYESAQEFAVDFSEGILLTLGSGNLWICKSGLCTCRYLSMGVNCDYDTIRPIEIWEDGLYNS